MPKVLGLDIGDSTIGVAMSDALGWTAQGVMTIRRKSMQQDLYNLRKLIGKHDVSEIVVGIPLKMNGKSDTQTRKTILFMQTLEERLHVPVHSWDERFSTVAASKALESGKVRGKKRAQLIDKVAATIILQGYLDHRNEVRGGDGN